ncbi:MAG: glycosyltransferase family 2 protein [Bacteroidia bacterium]
MNKPFVDIVILNHNGKKFLDECFTSVLNGNYKNQKVYLLDNASTDDDVFYVKQNFPEVEIIQNPNNNGYCAAYNLAFEACNSPYIVCLNNDVTVHPDWLVHLVELAESNSNISALQPKILSYYNHSDFEYAGASGGMMDVLGYPFLRGRIFDHIEKDNGQYDDIKEVFWTSGAAMFIRKSALEKCGVFDELIVHHMDEIDLCWRMRLSGFEMKVQPKSEIYHIGGASIPKNSFKKVYWNHRNSLYLLLKNYSISNLLLFSLGHFLLDIVAAWTFLLQGNFTAFKAIAYAHIWIVKNIPVILKKRKEVQHRRSVADSNIKKAMYKGSIVWESFVCKRNTYQTIKNYTS